MGASISHGLSRLTTKGRRKRGLDLDQTLRILLLVALLMGRSGDDSRLWLALVSCSGRSRGCSHTNVTDSTHNTGGAGTNQDEPRQDDEHASRPETSDADKYPVWSPGRPARPDPSSAYRTSQR